jgi:uncharacterized membrane protein YhdT
MNPLDNLPQIRKALYVVQWVLNGIATVLGAYFAVATEKGVDQLPEWYVISLAVLPVLWTYLGLTASQNVGTPPPPP